MTATEFTFLAIGLVLGMASGAALIEVIRARPPARRDVRVTVSQDAVPRRRATTLADDAFVTVGPAPARGGPADRRALETPAPVGAVDRRTNVPSGDLRSGSLTGRTMRPAAEMVGMPIARGSDPVLGELQARAAAPLRPRAAVQPGVAADLVRPAVALLDRPVNGGSASASPGTVAARPGPCAEERRLAEERCELASMARARAAGAAEVLHDAQRAYDRHSAAAEAAAEASNPKSVRTLKEAAQRDFRAASRAASNPEEVEGAARAWLHRINRINQEAAGAALTADREREAGAAIGARLERLGLEADAARIGAAMADAACLAARSASADCDEMAAPQTIRVAPGPQAGTAQLEMETEAETSSGLVGDDTLGLALAGGGRPRIFELLRGDPAVIEGLVASLADEDPDQPARLRLAFAALVSAIVADAINDSFLRFPGDHVFWGPFSMEQSRGITRALAALGYRFDGLGGWVDERAPSQRELSLALGYAGLDPMRVRQWPTEAQTAELFRNVEIAADEYLMGVAGELSLAQMVELLGRRADGLVELWNHWGRIRPLLLEDA